MNASALKTHRVGYVTSGAVNSMGADRRRGHLDHQRDLSEPPKSSKFVSNVVNGPDGPISYTLGNGLNVYRSYDAMGRLYGQWVCSGPANATCSGGTQMFGTLGQWKGSQLQNLSDTVLNQQVTNGYDGFNRLTSRTVTSGTPQNYTYSYDRYGNRVSQTALQTGYNF